jgi:hypothetical protein
VSTLGDLINTIASSLHSYTGVQEISTHLTAGITASVTSASVDSSDQVMRGIVEIDDELLYVTIADSNVLTIAPYGRGYRGSTAATHSTNAQVLVDPTFPRSEIRKAIDQCVLGLYPQLYQIKTTDLVASTTAVGYSLPADCGHVLDVKFQTTGDPADYWAPLYNYSFDASSPEVNGKALNLFDSLPPNSTIRVVYQAAFGTFASNSDTLTSIGLKEDWIDLILYQVASRMVRFLDPARLNLRYVENVSRSQVVQAGDAGKIANQLYAMYQQRLAEERKKLLEITPTRINFTR